MIWSGVPQWVCGEEPYLAGRTGPTIEGDPVRKTRFWKNLVKEAARIARELEAEVLAWAEEVAHQHEEPEARRLADLRRSQDREMRMRR
jgi:hypothetical protein